MVQGKPNASIFSHRASGGSWSHGYKSYSIFSTTRGKGEYFGSKGFASFTNSGQSTNRSRKSDKGKQGKTGKGGRNNDKRVGKGA